MQQPCKLRAALVTTIWLCFTLASPSFALDRQEFISGCLAGIKSKEYMAVAKKSIDGFSKAVAQAALRYNTAIINTGNGAVVMCNDMYAMAVREPATMAKIRKELKEHGVSKTGTGIAFELTSGYFRNGLKRLDSASLTPYFSLNQELFPVLKPKFCKPFILGTFSDPNAIRAFSSEMIRAQKYIRDEVQIAYYLMAEKAIKAEFEGGSGNKAIGREELLGIDDIFGEYLFAYGQAMFSKQRLEIMAQVLLGKSDLPEKDYCEFGHFYYGALASMPGPDGDKMRKFFIETHI